ncbi:MAG: carbamoyl-phosphate synthase large subunit [Synergistales bacterium]|nr:carbamoyl-phosphate synthase large subunit [Synergistales bacterium]
MVRNVMMEPGTHKQILVIGSGPIRIGQAAEFDYSGCQACRALKEEGCRVILLNSNPATIQTDVSLADVIYIRPLLADVVEDILKTHKPDAVLATLGGQVALNLAVELEEKGIWERYGVKVLGTSTDSIKKSEGREAFRKVMESIGEPVIESAYVSCVEAATVFAGEAGFPLVIRPDFTLGGTGGGVARGPEALSRIVEEGLRASPVHRVLVERYLEGWHEIELEVMRDGAGNVLCVCGMENIDPMGIHTGDSIVAAPTLTLTDSLWQRFKASAFRIVDALDVRGACNVQYALSPAAERFAVIEVNPRASRSSALASKATGYPIARIAAKIALGKNLTELPNPVTGKGNALSEPTPDYVVVKFPRWPFEKFPQADASVGTRMKSTGEVMSIGTSFIEALMKAIRSLDGPFGISDPLVETTDSEALYAELKTPTHRRLWAMLELLRRGEREKPISKASGIHEFFVKELAKISRLRTDLERKGPQEHLLKEAAIYNFPEDETAAFCGITREELRESRGWKEHPRIYRMIGRPSGEVASGSGYWYATRGGFEGDQLPDGQDRRTAIAVLGSGPIRIGQGVEFDYCCVKAVEALKKRNKRAIIINNNPETVSTDHDVSDALYFEPLSTEDVLPIIKREKVEGMFACFGGQTSLKLGLDLDEAGIPLLGTPCAGIKTAEDREKFSSLLNSLGIPQPKGAAVASVQAGLKCAAEVGYPVMIRPSFVIGGLAMQAVSTPDDLEEVLKMALEIKAGQTVLIDRFLPGREFEVDALYDGKDVLIPGVFEHLDPPGVHSGDSIAVFPDVSLSVGLKEKILETTVKIAEALQVRGMMNIQFVQDGDDLYVIEANPRASRTIPIATKLTGIPLVEIAVDIALGKGIATLGWPTGLQKRMGPMGVKVPVFSTEKLPGVDSRLGPAMQSTGESLGVADNVSEALWEALRGAGWVLPEKGKMLLSVSDAAKGNISGIASAFCTLGWSIDATKGTAEVLEKWGIPCGVAEKGEGLQNSIKKGNWDLVINIPSASTLSVRDGFAIRRSAIEAGVPCLGTLQSASAIGVALSLKKGGDRC